MNLKKEGIERMKEKVCTPWEPELLRRHKHKRTNKKCPTSPPNAKAWQTAWGKAFFDKYF